MSSNRLILIFSFSLVLITTLLLGRLYFLKSTNQNSPLTANDNYRPISVNTETLVPGLKPYAAYIGPLKILDYEIVGDGETQDLLMKLSLVRNNSRLEFKIKQVPCEIGDRFIEPVIDLDKEKIYMLAVLGTTQNPIVSEMQGSHFCRSVWGKLKASSPDTIKKKLTLEPIIPIFKNEIDLTDELISVGIVEYQPN